MNEYLVTCANRVSGLLSDYTVITHIGGPDFGTLTKEEAIKQIESGQSKFYVYDNNKNSKVYIRVVNQGTGGGLLNRAFGKKYLRTDANDDETDNLGNLPDCSFFSSPK